MTDAGPECMGGQNAEATSTSVAGSASAAGRKLVGGGKRRLDTAPVAGRRPAGVGKCRRGRCDGQLVTAFALRRRVRFRVSTMRRICWSGSGSEQPKTGSYTKGYTLGFVLGDSDFDDSLGFPGEGPRFNIISTNVNRWSSFAKSYQEGKMPKANIHCIQEHRLVKFNNEIGRAQAWCKARDLAHSFSEAQITSKEAGVPGLPFYGTSTVKSSRRATSKASGPDSMRSQQTCGALVQLP